MPGKFAAEEVEAGLLARPSREDRRAARPAWREQLKPADALVRLPVPLRASTSGSARWVLGHWAPGPSSGHGAHLGAAAEVAVVIVAAAATPAAAGGSEASLGATSPLVGVRAPTADVEGTCLAASPGHEQSPVEIRGVPSVAFLVPKGQAVELGVGTVAEVAREFAIECRQDSSARMFAAVLVALELVLVFGPLVAFAFG